MDRLSAGPSDPVAVRSAGVLLPARSLPGGTLAGADDFIDWLSRAGQSWWQVLPLGPPDAFGSPYASPSAFAGDPGLLGAPGAPVGDDERERFRRRESYWIDDWVAFAGLGALDDQVRFDREWAAVRSRAAERGIRILGDVPFYVAADSAEVRARPDLFLDDVVAGVPPDDFSADGQLWGNPPYDWDRMRSDGYRWWVERLRRTTRLVDAARIDHFRGFAAWWAVPRGESSAMNGSWRPGPADALFARLDQEVAGLALVAEDLGVITPDVVALIERLGLPGIRVVQYAFGGGDENPHRLGNQPRRAMVVTGTHDNDTARGWWESAPGHVREAAWSAARSVGVVDDEPHRMLVGLTHSSRPALAMVPMQDVLGLGSWARTNTPATTAGNWSWVLDPDDLTDDSADWLRNLTSACGRLPQAEVR